MPNTTKSGKQSVETLMETIAQSEAQRREQRRQFNFDQLTQGRVGILNNDECVADLIEQLSQKDDGDRELQRRLLIGLSEALSSTDLSIRERALMVISHAGAHAYFRDDRGTIFLVVHHICSWLQQETELPAGSVVVLRRLEELTGWLIEKAFWNETEKVVGLLHDIVSGELAKGAAVKSLASQTLQRLASEVILGKVCDAYLHEDNQQPRFAKILLAFGSRAVHYLLQRVHQCVLPDERMALLHLLSTYGSLFCQVAEGYVKEQLPWTMLRNILFVVGELAEEEGYPLVKRHLTHEDLRVQHEALSCLPKIGGPHLSTRLLHALETVDIDLKPHVLQLLSERSSRDGDILRTTLGVLQRRHSYAPEIKDRMICSAIAVLKVYPEPDSVEMLQLLSQECRRTRGGTVHLQLEEALHSLRPQLRHKLRRIKKTETVSFDDDPEKLQKAMTQLKTIEETLRALLGKGDVDEASQLLRDSISVAVREKQLILAGKLCDRLLQINPMALKTVLALGEEIERAKNHHAFDPRPDLWGGLFSKLSKAEHKAIVSLMRPEQISKGQLVVGAGESDHVLYFLEAGQVTLHCRSGRGETFLKRIGPGAILGAEQFFSPSVWTYTLKTATDVLLQVIEGRDFTEAAETHLTLEEKVRTYCKEYTNIPHLLKMSGDDRRDFPRFDIPLSTRNTLIDHFGNKGKRSFRGELLDISRSGLSFIIRISSRNSGKQLLGRRIQNDIEGGGDLIMASCNGVIVGVRYRDHHTKNATIHVKLSDAIDKELFEKIISLR